MPTIEHTPRTVFVFPNGLVAVTNRRGEQLAELQGPDSPALRARIRARSDAQTLWVERTRRTAASGIERLHVLPQDHDEGEQP
jgi:hypothetical protein